MSDGYNSINIPHIAVTILYTPDSGGTFFCELHFEHNDGTEWSLAS